MSNLVPQNTLTRVVLRHDHDGGKKLPLSLLCDIEEAAGFRSSIHILVDGLDYDPLPLVPFWKDLSKRGFDIGLHSQCWMRENYEEAFFDDLAKFELLLGFKPKTMSLHGAWPRSDIDMRRREEFLGNLNKYLRDTDIAGYNNTFSWVLEDSSIGGEVQPLTWEFSGGADFIFRGGVGLILTHDGNPQLSYWS